MFVSNETIYNELKVTQKLLKQILEKEVDHSIEELSLYKASKLLRLSQDSVIDLVKKGKLSARKYKDNKRRTRYRFRVADIRRFQENNKYDHFSIDTDEMEIESPEEIADRIFPNRRKAV